MDQLILLRASLAPAWGIAAPLCNRILKQGFKMPIKPLAGKELL